MVKLVRMDLEFILDQIRIAEQHAAGTPLAQLIPDPQLPWGLRTVDGSYNNIVPGREEFGAADNVFPRMLQPSFRPGYEQTSPTSIVTDAQPRIISNLIADQTTDNPAAIVAMNARGGVAMPDGSVLIPNVAPDFGISAPFNSWMTLFGQFFDHGLDLVNKGGSGTIFMPLQPDDPLYNPNAPTNFLVLTRATNQPGPDGILGTADDVHEHVNQTTPWVDQNQTYTSHPSHQVFLREYALLDGRPVATGKMLDGANGGLPTWAEVKAQARSLLGIDLTDADVTNLPLLATDPYGKFIPGPNGLPQVVMAGNLLQEGNLASPISLTNAVRTGHAFLDDIAHAAAPRNADGTLKTPDADSVPGVNDGIASTYDNELLDAHYITGDGRGNENIGLTAVHHVFHAEHNRLVEHIKRVVLETGDPAFIQEWLLPGANQADGIASLEWNGERLFQAARFGTEMQYQHLVFEEFARKVQPLVRPFVFNNSPEIDPAIVAEFAHTVYRFGHSMLNDDIARMNPDGTSNDIGLIQAFLNPLEFAAGGTAEAAAGAIVRGMTRQHANEIDEFVVDAVRNNLLGLPLDLAAINIARGRDTGVPSLNAARQQFYDQTGSSFLKPYTSWFDFALNLKTPASVINFIAAYGTHDIITAATTAADKRAAATALVLGGSGAPADRLDYLNGTGSWAGRETGLNLVDFWIGGLAEKQMPFGGLLGSTFNFVFEAQLERLQDGDRLYYLSRLQGQNLLNELEANSFASLVARNTDLSDPGPDGIRGTGDDFMPMHLPADIFALPAYILEAVQANQRTGIGPDGRGDPTGQDPVLEAINPLVIRRSFDDNGDGTPDRYFLQHNGIDHVVLGGSQGNDTLIAYEGDDAIWGDGGDDFIEGGAGIDMLRGGAGDDTIMDSGDTGDNLQGGDGNDVISNANGIDLILAGDGSDFVAVGVDRTEVFGGRGNDFILGGPEADFLLGNEGDDWIEGGPGFDVIAGDNSELFFNSRIIGHDVLLDSGGGDMDYDAESGDDIMVQSETVTRNEGMFGFDWAIHKNDPFPANSDLRIPIFTTVQADILRDRFDQVEGLSGWHFNDTLRGDDRGNAPNPDPAVGFDQHILTEEGMDRIAGLRELVGNRATLNPVTGRPEFRDGNILLGGDGSDIIEGRGANDLIDGDAWLNVRLEYVDVFGNRGTVDSLNAIRSRLLSGEIKPNQLTIVREILRPANVADDIDTAVFSDVFANYTITRNADGTYTVAHTGGTGIDGTDTLRNIERLQFADQAMFLNLPATGTVTISDTTPTEGQTLTAARAFDDPNGVNVATITFQWQVETAPNTWTVVGTGASFQPGAGQVGLRLRVTATFQDLLGNPETVTSAPTEVVGDRFISTSGADQPTLTAGDDFASGLGGADRLLGLAGSDTLDGGAGSDTLDGGAGADSMIGGGGNDLFFVDNVADIVSEAGGGGTDTIRTTLASYTLGANVENLIYEGTGNFTGTGNGAANRLEGASGNDTLNGGNGADLLVGGAGTDDLTGGAGADRFQWRSVNQSGRDAATADRVRDFTPGAGDLLDLALIDPPRDADGVFSFVGTGPFLGGNRASVRYEQDATNGWTLVLLDQGNGGAAEMVIRLDGLLTLTAANFIL